MKKSSEGRWEYRKGKQKQSLGLERRDYMKSISTIRRTVTTMANQLHKLGYSLSQAFRTAWKRVKESMTCRVSGVTYECNLTE